MDLNNLFLSLVLTILLEYAVYVLFFKKINWESAGYCLLINSVTLPLANFAYIFLERFYIIELCVFLTEIFLIKILFKSSWKKSMIISFTANFITMLLGILIAIFLN